MYGNHYKIMEYRAVASRVNVMNDMHLFRKPISKLPFDKCSDGSLQLALQEEGKCGVTSFYDNLISDKHSIPVLNMESY